MVNLVFITHKDSRTEWVNVYLFDGDKVASTWQCSGTRFYNFNSGVTALAQLKTQCGHWHEITQQQALAKCPGVGTLLEQLQEMAHKDVPETVKDTW